MTVAQQHRVASPRRDGRPTAGQRTGYLVAALVNGAVLWVLHQLLGWGWPPFLTPAFDDLLPWIGLSLGASIVVNLLWAVRNPHWFQHLGQAGLDVLSLIVALQTWWIFPFEFSVSFPWATVFYVVLAVSIFGLAVATVSELVALVRGPRPDRSER